MNPRMKAKAKVENKTKANEVEIQENKVELSNEEKQIKLEKIREKMVNKTITKKEKVTKEGFNSKSKLMATELGLNIIKEDVNIRISSGKVQLLEIDNWKGAYRFLCGFSAGVKSTK